MDLLLEWTKESKLYLNYLKIADPEEFLIEMIRNSKSLKELNELKKKLAK